MPIKSIMQNQPLLLLPNDGDERSWRTYSVFEGKAFEASLSIPSSCRRFTGSSQGWLITLNHKLVITLHKAFSMNKIVLPPLFPDDIVGKINVLKGDFLDFYVPKVSIFTPDPLSNPTDLICVVIFGSYGELAYIRPKVDTTWTRVTGMEKILINDVIHHNDKFYALTYDGKLAAFDPLVSPNIYLVAHNLGIPDRCCEGVEFFSKSYLVQVGGDFLQIKRYVDSFDDFTWFVTNKFRVFKLTSVGESMWVEIKNLGDNVALFLGDNSSVSIDSSQVVGCKGNSIYFTEDKEDGQVIGVRGATDMGVFDLETGSITRFSFDASTVAKMQRRVPIWLYS